MQIGIRIKELRECCGFTQRNIADFLNVDQSFISKIEKGERSLTADMIKSISDLFGVETSYFLNDNKDVVKTNCAFRANDLTAEDLETISCINRIALNANFMTELLGE